MSTIHVIHSRYTFHAIQDKLLNHDGRFTLCTILGHNNIIAQFFSRHKVVKVAAVCIIFHLRRESTLLYYCVAIQSMPLYAITILKPLMFIFVHSTGK